MFDKLVRLGVKSTAIIVLRKLVFAYEDAEIVISVLLGKQATAYIGFVGHANLGDEILYEAHKSLLNRLSLVNVNYMLTLKITGWIRKPFFNYAILGGGTLIDHSDNWLLMVEQLLLDGTKLLCLGTGVEDIDYWPKNVDKHRHIERWVKALNQFEYIGVRGPLSKRTLSGAGLKRANIVGDTALALYDEIGLAPKKANQKIVGITYGVTPGQSQWGDGVAYTNNIKKIIRSLLGKGYIVRLLPIWDLDVKCNLLLQREIGDSRCQMIRAFGTLEDFTRQLNKCDYFVGQKLHASIMALMSGVPTIMLEYQPKCRDFMASVDLEEYVIKTSELEFNNFFALFDKLRSDKQKITSSSAAKIIAYKKAQEKLADTLMVEITKSSRVA